MTEGHPTPDLLESFMRNEVGVDHRRIVRHLLTGCARCTAVTRRFWSFGEPRGLPGEGSLESHPALQGRASRRLSELLDLTVAERLERIRGDARYQTPALCGMLIQESRLAGEAVVAAERGEEAVAVAERLAESRYGGTLVRSFQARSLAYLANGRRRTRDLKKAEDALSLAERLVAEGGDGMDPLDRAEVEELRARLLADQGKPEEAERRLGQALKTYRSHGLRHLQGRVLVQQGAIRGWIPGEGSVLNGIEQLREGLALLDFGEDPGLAAFAFHRLALLLLEAGLERESLRTLYRARRFYQELEDGPNLVRLRHLEGRIAERLGAPDVAEAAFLEARRNYLLESLGADAARVLLDLAILYRRQGRPHEIPGLAQDLLPIFQTRDVRQDVGFALLFFRRLAETGHTHLEVLVEVARFLAGPPKARCPMLR